MTPARTTRKRNRLIAFLLLAAMILVAGCSSIQSAPEGSQTSSRADPADTAVDGTLGEDGLELELSGIVIEVPASAAPPGTIVHAELANQEDVGAAAIAASDGVAIALGDGLQPSAPIAISFPVHHSVDAVAENGRDILVRTTDAQGVSLSQGTYSPATHTYQISVEHLSGFQLFRLDFEALWQEARIALMQGLKLEYPEPDCTADSAELDGYTYRVSSPPQSWLCLETINGVLHAVAYPNSAIPFEVDSDHADRYRTSSSGLSLGHAAMMTAAERLGLIGEERAVVMPGVEAHVAIAGTPEKASLAFRQYPVLLLLAILGTVGDTALDAFGVDPVLTEKLQQLSCLQEVADAAPAAAALTGESVAGVSKSFFACAGTLGGDALRGGGAIILAILGGGTTALVASILGVVNEFAGSSTAVVDLEVTVPKPTCGAKDYGLHPDAGNFGGLEASSAKARLVYQAALDCDSETLIRVLREDETEFTLGTESLEEAFAIPSPENRYWVLTRLMSLQPAIDMDTISWPSRDELTGMPDIDQLESLGLLTAEEANAMRNDPQSPFIGWKLSINPDGKVSSFFHLG